MQRKVDQQDEFIGILYSVCLNDIRFKDEALFRTPYFGQSVRALGTPSDVAEARWEEEEFRAHHELHHIGFLAVLRQYGRKAMKWSIIRDMRGSRDVVQAWADDEEIKLIAQHGGVLKDMHKKLHQTLNQTTGGKANSFWQCQDAARRNCFNTFKKEMESYVSMHNTSLVAANYVNPSTGYRLGRHLTNFRLGVARANLPEQADIEAWAERLPDWAWNGTKSSIAKSRRSEKETKRRRAEKVLDPEASVVRAVTCTATCSSRRASKLASMSGEARRKQIVKYANADRFIAKQKATLILIQSVYPQCTQREVEKYKEYGLMPFGPLPMV